MGPLRRRRKTDAGRVTGFILLLILAATFIFSATGKLVAIEPFEWTFMDMGFSYPLAAIAARSLIGFEYLIALFLLGHCYLKRFTYPVTLVLLGVLSGYLVIQLLLKGNQGDCGCFGDALPMSPALGILKNAVLAALTGALIYLYPVSPRYRAQALLAGIGAVACMALPFVVMPNAQRQEPVNLDALYTDPDNRPQVELRQGKHLLAFMSLGCPHCRTAAKHLKEVYASDTTLPIFIILTGPPEGEAEFFSDTHAERVPHMLFRSPPDFLRLAGPYVPALYWINNSIRERKVSPHQVTADLLRGWRH